MWHPSGYCNFADVVVYKECVSYTYVAPYIKGICINVQFTSEYTNAPDLFDRFLECPELFQ